MDRTRSTVEDIDHKTMNDAYDAYSRGEDVGRLAARMNVYPVDLQREFDRIAAERERRASDPRAGAMGRMQDAMLDEIDRLAAMDATDQDAMRTEVERARAIEGIVRASIENIGMAVEVTRMRAQLSQGANVTIPMLLEG